MIAAGIVGHFTGLLYRFTAKTVAVQTLADDTVAQFQNPLLEQAARDYAGKAEGELTVADLKGLTALYVCGDRYWFTAPQQGVDAAAAGVETAEMTDPSGQSVTVRRGDIRDLSDLAYFPSLTVVSVQFQSLTSLESLPACGVEVFDVSANRLTSLSGIEQLPKLTALTADGNAVTDLTGLGRCLNVRKLSLNGANVSDLSELRALTKLQDITLSHCTRRELLIPLHKSSLTRLTLVNCDLRGDFFRSFDRERALTALSLIDCELDSTSGLEDFTGLTELTVRGVSGTLDCRRSAVCRCRPSRPTPCRRTPSPRPPPRPSRSWTDRRSVSAPVFCRGSARVAPTRERRNGCARRWMKKSIEKQQPSRIGRAALSAAG